MHRSNQQLHTLARSLCAAMTALAIILCAFVIPAAAEETSAPIEPAVPAETTVTVETTAAPAETTAEPAETTAAPAETTAPPAETTAPPAETTAPAETLAPAETFAPVLQPSDPGMSFAPIQGEPGALESAPLIVEGRAVDEPYQYLVTIEFGSFQFWYDWGEWDVDKLAYTKDASSKDPAADTVDGGPGWYGFDGVTNRIGVTYQAPHGVTEGSPWLMLSISFVPATVSPDSTNRVFNDATSFQFFNRMEKTEVDGQTVITYSQIDAEGIPEDGPVELSATEEGAWEPVVLDTIAPAGVEGQVHEYFLSLTGAPQNADNSPFRSANAVSLGLICIRIALVEAPTT